MLLHDNSRSPCSLIAEVADADIFLTIHGFQSIFLLFLPIPSILFEIFPYYYNKDVYQVISNSIGKKDFPFLSSVLCFGLETGILHGLEYSRPSHFIYSLALSLISMKSCARSLLCRTFTRSQNVM
jgi:hypothetical protein